MIFHHFNNFDIKKIKNHFSIDIIFILNDQSLLVCIFYMLNLPPYSNHYIYQDADTYYSKLLQDSPCNLNRLEI